MVSLFPRDTYKGRPNGLRKDLAEKIAALQPGLRALPRRLPGQHRQPLRLRRRVELRARRAPTSGRTPSARSRQRATNANFWGYNQSYGLGYYEYFQFAEDIGAMPLPVVPALVTGCGQNRATDDDGAAAAAHPGHPGPDRVRQRAGRPRRGARCAPRWATRSRSA